MPYREIVPPATARGVVACLWTRTASAADDTSVRVLPDGCVDIVWRTGAGAVLAGPDTRPVLSHVVPDGTIVGARFAPGAGGAAVRMPLADVRDARVPLADVAPALDRQLPPDLEPGEALVRLMALTARLALTAPRDPAIGKAVGWLAEPRTRVEALASELGLSDRQLRRRCHAAVGYGPKTLQRVLRFRRFLRAADAASAASPRGSPTGVDLAGLAFEAGYADQAHLTHDCTRLAGLPPAALLRLRRQE